MVRIQYTPPPPVQTSGGSSGGGFLSKFLPLAGAAAGGIAGSVVPVGGTAFGMAAGASLGMGLGGVAGGLVAKDPTQATYEQKPNPQQAGDSGDAMSRRMAELDNQPLKQIRDSLNALYTLPPEQRAEYGKPLLQAEYMARKQKA